MGEWLQSRLQCGDCWLLTSQAGAIVQSMAIQTFAFSTLSSGRIDPGELSFEPVQVPELEAPRIDPDNPERFGRPNYDQVYFYGRLIGALEPIAENIQYVVTACLARGHGARPTQTFVFHGSDSITPIQFYDDRGNYELWLAAISAPLAGETLRFGFSHNQRSAGVLTGLDTLLTDPADWIKQAAPNSWVAATQSAEKQQRLDEASLATGSQVSADPEAIGELWAELVQLREVDQNPGATDEEIASFEAVSGFPMPADLATLLSLSNGAQGAFGYRSLMSVDVIIRQWKEWKAIFDDFMIDDLFHGYLSDEDRTVAVYTNPHWVSFVDERTGNYAAVDLLPGPAGQHGQIIYFGADEQQIRCLASGLEEFLRREIAHGGTNEYESWF